MSSQVFITPRSEGEIGVRKSYWIGEFRLKAAIEAWEGKVERGVSKSLSANGAENSMAEKINANLIKQETSSPESPELECEPNANGCRFARHAQGWGLKRGTGKTRACEDPLLVAAGYAYGVLL